MVRTAVLNSVRKYLLWGTGDDELSTLVVRDLHSDWPALTEADVDLILAWEYAARAAEADVYRGAMQSALSTGRHAAEDVRSDACEGMRRKPARRAA